MYQVYLYINFVTDAAVTVFIQITCFLFIVEIKLVLKKLCSDQFSGDLAIRIKKCYHHVYRKKEEELSR